MTVNIFEKNSHINENAETGVLNTRGLSKPRLYINNMIVLCFVFL